MKKLLFLLPIILLCGCAQGFKSAVPLVKYSKEKIPFNREYVQDDRLILCMEKDGCDHVFAVPVQLPGQNNPQVSAVSPSGDQSFFQFATTNTFASGSYSSSTLNFNQNMNFIFYKSGQIICTLPMKDFNDKVQRVGDKLTIDCDPIIP